jgi:hypothetical protein
MTRHEFERIEYLAARRAKLVASKTPVDAREVDHERAVLREEVKQEGIRGALVANAVFDYFFALHTSTEDEAEVASVCDECGKPAAQSVDGGLRGERFLCRAHAARAFSIGEAF